MSTCVVTLEVVVSVNNPAGEVLTSKGTTVDVHTFMRFFNFAQRAKRKTETRMARMRVGRYGSPYYVTATHAGDLRVGCHLVEWDELERILRELRTGIKAPRS